MNEMIERVARALARQYYKYHFDRDHDGDWEDWTGPARAAIEAMREPTEAMTDLIWQETADPCWRENAIKAWQAGIDEALR